MDRQSKVRRTGCLFKCRHGVQLSVQGLGNEGDLVDSVDSVDERKRGKTRKEDRKHTDRLLNGSRRSLTKKK